MNVLARKVTNNLIRSTRSALPFSTSNTNSLFHHNNINQITGNNVNILTRQRRKRTTTIIGTSININNNYHYYTFLKAMPSMSRNYATGLTPEDAEKIATAKKLVESVENNPRLFSAKELKKRRWPVIIQEHARFPGDTGSPEVQIALLTEKITYLTEHFKVHKKDKHGRRGLQHILNQRHKLLLYLRRKNKERYEALIGKLNLKDRFENRL